ncbi:MAG: ABC transporter substrate-binding protein [Pseudomonadota bacterium]
MTSHTYLAALVALTSFLGGLPAAAQDCSDGLRPFEHAAGMTCIPEDPQRIVTLQDQNALLPLLELGVRPVGSAGHVLPDGSTVFRRVDGFDTDGIAFVGSYRGTDPEAVAALEPDLIIASPWPDGSVELYSPIAPTVVIDIFDQPLRDALHQFADVTNRSERAEELEAEFDGRVAAIRDALGDRLDETTISILSYWGGNPGIVPAMQSTGLALSAFDPVRAELEVGHESWDPISWEVLGDNPSDVTFVFANSDDQVSSIDAAVADFLSDPIVQATTVARADQIVPVASNQVMGASWGAATRMVEALAEGIGREGLNRDLVIE